VETQTGQSEKATPSLPLYLSGKGYTTGFVGSNPFIFPGNYIGADLGFSTNESLNHRKFDTVAIEQRAKNFIDLNKDRPFFLYLHFDNCHGDFKPPSEFKEKWARADGEKGANWPAAYDAEVAHADEKIGKILAHLEKLNLTQNTLFVITSDHGMSYEPGHPFGHTHSLYESEIRVPLIMAFPGKIPENQRIIGLKSLLDLYPTIVKMRGESDINPYSPIEIRQNNIAGQDLFGVDLFDSQQPDMAAQRTIYIEGAGITAVRQSKNKLIMKNCPYDKLKGHQSTDKGRLLEIYNLENDPKELSNLAGIEKEDEALFLEKLWERKVIFSKLRKEQLEMLSNYMGQAAQELYPERANEAYELRIAAGDKDRTFTLVIDPARKVGSYLGQNFEIGDQIIVDKENSYVVIELTVKAGKTKKFAFSTFPTDDPVVIQATSDKFEIGEIYIGEYSIAYPAYPLIIEKPRDFRLITAERSPKIRTSEHGIYLWRWSGTKTAITTMGGHVKSALRSWGYVK